MVYLVFLIDSLLYLAAVPVCAAFCVSSADGLRAGAGVGVFVSRGAWARARRAMAGARRRGRRGDYRRALGLARRLRLSRFSLRGRLGLGDAAATALAGGAVTALLGAALRSRADAVEIRLAPDFSGEPRVELRGMIRVRAGQIILAAAKGGVNEICGRIAHGKAPD